MQPHPSYFVADGGTFGLSGPLSEWLFSTGLWSETESTLSSGYMFGHYEETEVPFEHLPEILNIIARLKVRIQNDPDISLECHFAWTPEGEIFRARVERYEAVSELGQLIVFLQKAHASEQSVEFFL